MDPLKLVLGALTVLGAISFVDGQAVAGDVVRVRSDGTKWYSTAQSAVAAGITFTDVD